MKNVISGILLSTVFAQVASANTSALDVLQNMNETFATDYFNASGKGVSDKGDKCLLFLSSNAYDFRVRAEAVKKNGEGSLTSTLDSGLVITDYNSETYENNIITKYEVSVAKKVISISIEAEERFSFNSFVTKHSINLKIKGDKITSGQITSSLLSGSLNDELSKKQIGTCTVK